MQEIKDFIEVFFSKEVNKNTNEIKPDIKAYNKSINEYNEIVIDQLKFEPITKLKDDDFYGMYKDQPNFRPRHLLKISEYSNNKYGSIWVAYVSQINPRPKRKYLSEALFIIKEQEQFKIAREYRYSDYESDGIKYEWKGRSGYQDLTFESLDGPIAIERYQEPLKDFDGLKHYNDNI